VDLRERRTADLPACVAALRSVHEADGYPLTWPLDPAAWLSPPQQAQAWVAELPDLGLTGHIAVQITDVTSTATPTGAGPSGGAPTDGVPNAGQSTSAEISRLFVVPAARRRGVAEALIARAAQWARRRHLSLVLEVVDEGHSSAIAFYESHGWQCTGTTVADWTGPGGSPVKLRHYRRGAPGC